MAPELELDVVIPVRDVVEYLDEAIESALGQAGVICAVIVVDAGSTSPVRLSAAHAAHPAVTLVRSELPLTAGAARNLGAAHGSGDWLAFLDADDVWPAESRRALLSAAIGGSADLAVGAMTSFHSDDGSRSALVAPPDSGRALLPGAIVLARRAWAEVGLFDASLRVGEFVEWYNRASAAGLVEVDVPLVVLRRRIHLASMTARGIHDRGDYLEVVRRWMNRTDS
jgi:glycosyltransferase involved in cell wall biosynthesis